VVKQSAVDEVMLRHQGPARVFDSEEEATKVILDRKIKKGRLSLFGMKALKGTGDEGNAGSNLSHCWRRERSGCCFTHRRPFFRRKPWSGNWPHLSRSSRGGPIAVVRNGDQIAIDIPGKKLNLLIPNQELRKGLSMETTKKKLKGYLKRYAGLVTSANTGATFED